MKEREEFFVMEQKKKRKYKVVSLFDKTPVIKITGKWLKEQGFDTDTIYEVIQGKNMLVLTKITN